MRPKVSGTDLIMFELSSLFLPLSGPNRNGSSLGKRLRWHSLAGSFIISVFQARAY